MNHRKSLMFVGAALLATLAISACGGSDKVADSPTREFTDNPTPIAGVSTAAEFPLSIPRSDGKTSTLPQPAARIVSLSPGATEIIYAIAAHGGLIAVSTTADYPLAATTFATKLDPAQTTVEAVTALNPDLVIVASNANGLIAALDQAGIPVFYQDDASIKSVGDVLGQIVLLGKVTGKNQEASTLVTALGTRIRAVEDTLQGASVSGGHRVYHEVDPTFVTISDDSLTGDLYRTLRVRNIAGDGGGSARPQLNAATIIASDPTVIVLADEAQGVTVDAASARPGWSAIDAVINDRVYTIDGTIVSRPGPRIVDALEQLAKLIYPTRFP
jgi:iron complex transport system substrate-binding protein